MLNQVCHLLLVMQCIHFLLMYLTSRTLPNIIIQRQSMEVDRVFGMKIVDFSNY